MKPLVLCILDGWGAGKNSAHNAITNAKPQYFNSIMRQYPHALLQTSGPAVGLPVGQMGNSETGHMTIGSGRVIQQDLERINSSIASGEFKSNNHLQAIIGRTKPASHCCHLIGLFSDGGVHSHINHILQISDFLVKNNVNVCLHVITDGRDTLPKVAIQFLKAVNCQVATLSGRFYAMDRDNRIDRTVLAGDVIIKGADQKFVNVADVIDASYKLGITDEFIVPCSHQNYHGMKDGDDVIFCNFRADRMRQLTEYLCNSEVKFASINTMTSYSEKIDRIANILYTSIPVTNILSDVLAQHKIRQFKIAETEKYPHITYFFNAGKEHVNAGEVHCLVPSPKVKTYDVAPEMSAKQITQKLLQAIAENLYDFILVNFANADMVGHTGNYEATIKAVRVIDLCLAQLGDAVLAKNGTLLITADHGNAESMFDVNENSAHTSHTTNPVPFVIINNELNIKVSNGSLADVAPTILDLLNINIPKEMTGKSLVQYVAQN